MRKPKVKIIPWVECNSSSKKALAHVLRGMAVWSRVTNTVIVSTVPGKEHIYRELSKGVVPHIAVPKHMVVIPGVKTHPVLDRFDSLKGWKAVAKSVEAILKHCPGATQVLLENETAMKPYIDGKQKINLRQLARGVSCLPREVEYLWWPTYAGHSYAIQDRYFAVVNAIASQHTLCFISRRLASPTAPDDVWMRYAARGLELTARSCWSYHSSVPIIWCGGDKRHSKAWHYKQVPSVLDMVEGDEAILYPGSKNWVEAAKNLASILLTGSHGIVTVRGRIRSVRHRGLVGCTS